MISWSLSFWPNGKLSHGKQAHMLADPKVGRRFLSDNVKISANPIDPILEVSMCPLVGESQEVEI